MFLRSIKLYRRKHYKVESLEARQKQEKLRYEKLIPREVVWPEHPSYDDPIVWISSDMEDPVLFNFKTESEKKINEKTKNNTILIYRIL